MEKSLSFTVISTQPHSPKDMIKVVTECDKMPGTTQTWHFPPIVALALLIYEGSTFTISV